MSHKFSMKYCEINGKGLQTVESKLSALDSASEMINRELRSALIRCGCENPEEVKISISDGKFDMRKVKEALKC